MAVRSYQYKCKDGHSFEEQILDRYTQACPECGKYSVPLSVPNSPMFAPVPIYLNRLRGGRQFDEIPGTERMRPPTPPAELVKAGLLNPQAE